MNELPFDTKPDIFEFFGKTTNHEDDEWMNKIKDRLHQMPARYRLQFLDVGSGNMQIERAKHLETCQSPITCPAIRGIENRTLMIETVKEDLDLPTDPVFQEERESPKKTKEFTTARQVLAVHYLMKCLNVQVDKTEIAQLIVFLTGKNSVVVRFIGTLNLQVLCDTHSQRVQGFYSPATSAFAPLRRPCRL